MHLRIWDRCYVGSEAWLVIEYGARHFFDGPTGERSSNRSKNFTNIHPIVTETGSKDAPSYTFEYGTVCLAAFKLGGLLSMMLITI